MGHNMMTTQKWYEHITNVIIGNTANFNSGCLDSIDYVDEKKRRSACSYATYFHGR